MSNLISGSPPYVAGAAAALVCVAIYVGLWAQKNLRRLPYPPGPKGYPIIGNLLEIPDPLKEPWRVFDQWKQIYGDMVYFEVLGQPFLILGTLEKTQELFDKRSTKYSSRPDMPMIRDLMGYAFTFAFHPYGQLWRKDRRAFHHHFQPDAITEYEPVQLNEVHVFLKLLLDTPENFIHHIQHLLSATIIRIAYGIRIEPNTDSIYLSVATAAVAALNETAVPGAYMVDAISILKYVPAWFPGASFKRKAAKWRKEAGEFVNLPYDHAKELMSKNMAESSILTKFLDALPEENDPSREEEENRAKYLLSTAYAAGSDPTISAVQSFFLAMAMHPEVAKKAQAEIDTVVGTDRLPNFSDQPLLPYISAMIKELLRWKLVANLGIVHSVSEDDEVDGYFIPKGTIVAGNAWAILHDPEVFENPDDFNPERYLKDGKINPDTLDPVAAAFGYGRRMCAGRHLAQQSLFIVVVSTLAAFDIRAPLDDSGKPIKMTAGYHGGLISTPLPFKCQITPRSAAVAKIIQDSLQ